MFSSHMGKSSYCIKIFQRIKEVCFLIVFLDVKVAAKNHTVSNLSFSFFFQIIRFDVPSGLISYGFAKAWLDL